MFRSVTYYYVRDSFGGQELIELIEYSNSHITALGDLSGVWLLNSRKEL
jgi:hypothetical protein